MKQRSLYYWKVGVHFNHYFTNVYVNQNGIVKPLPLESLHLKVAYPDDETRSRILTQCLISEEVIPSDKPLLIQKYSRGMFCF